MISFKAGLIRTFMRNRHFLKWKFKLETIDQSTSIKALRKNTDEAAKRMVKPTDGVSFQAAEDAPVYAEWVKPQGCNEKDMVLYFHGGGIALSTLLK